jgi:hypothetical protein
MMRVKTAPYAEIDQSQQVAKASPHPMSVCVERDLAARTMNGGRNPDNLIGTNTVCILKRIAKKQELVRGRITANQAVQNQMAVPVDEKNGTPTKVVGANRSNRYTLPVPNGRGHTLSSRLKADECVLLQQRADNDGIGLGG